jgi:RimJ/RimL family protein N-acetyltransferase
MKVNVVPFKTEHWWRMEVRPEISEAEILWSKQVKPEFLYEKFPSLTIMDGPRIIACFGGVYLWPNTAEGWVRTVPDVYKYKDILFEQVNRLSDFLFDIWNLNRMQATVQKDWTVACKFAERLGYISEGELPYYIGNYTYIMYAKLRSN